jgi:tetratricopeptide (TPR) repeat protein
MASSALKRAHAEYTAGRYQAAVDACLALFQAEPSNAANLLLLGAAYFQLRQYDEALRYSQLCAQANPKYAEAYGEWRKAGQRSGAILGRHGGGGAGY